MFFPMYPLRVARALRRQRRGEVLEPLDPGDENVGRFGHAVHRHGMGHKIARLGRAEGRHHAGVLFVVAEVGTAALVAELEEAGQRFFDGLRADDGVGMARGQAVEAVEGRGKGRAVGTVAEHVDGAAADGEHAGALGDEQRAPSRPLPRTGAALSPERPPPAIMTS